MESVKILIANKSQCSGKSALGIALANYIYNISDDIHLQPTLFDCSENHNIFKKRVKELEGKNNKIHPFEILPLSLNNDSLLNQILNIIYERDALYIFDLSSYQSQALLFQLLFSTDILICPTIITSKGLNETKEFLDFIQKSLKVFKVNGIDKTIAVDLIPFMITETGINDDINSQLEEIIATYFPECNILPGIRWRQDLLNDISTLEYFFEFQDLFKETLEKVYSHIKETYKQHFSS